MKHGWQEYFISIKSDHYLYSRYRWKHLRSLLHIRYVLDISKLNGPLALSFRFFETPHWPCFLYMIFMLKGKTERKKGWDTKAKSFLLRDAAEQDIGETIMLDLLLHILLMKTDDCTFSLCSPPKDIKIQFGWFSQAHNTVYVWSLSIRNLPRVFQCKWDSEGLLISLNAETHSFRYLECIRIVCSMLVKYLLLFECQQGLFLSATRAM